jgi:xylan 1,4-beta-xylosidase
MKFTVFADKPCGKVNPYWKKCVGSCHAATALREDWRKQLIQCHEEFGFEYVRFHGLLDDDMSVCLKNEKGVLEYSFFNVDSIFDFLLDIGMKPFIELSFMPTALASSPKTVMHYRANITPPKSWDEWGNLIEALAGHLEERYGSDEVRKWFFEVWNEPNLPDFFWAGTMEDYFKLYEYAARAVKKVDGQLKVGGPATAIDEWIPELRAYCELHGVPLDFISTHHYPTDSAFGLGLDMEEQMARQVRGNLRGRVQRAREESGTLPLYYTEWNCSPSPRDPYHDKPYNAAFIVKTVMNNLGLVECYSFWTFSDIFEEAGFSSMPFHGGFGLLNIHGIPKPSYRAFQMLSLFKGYRLVVAVQEDSPTVECAAAGGENGITILISNHQVPRAPVSAEQVSITVEGINSLRKASLTRIDETHANPQKAWVEMGSPTYPDKFQIQKLMEASETAEELVDWVAEGSGISVNLLIQPHSAIAVTLK